jgi:iron complex transport system ATP-binding protein
MVELRDVSWRVGAARIVQDVRLQFRSGKFNVILGPNGAGKSTLLKLATGLLAPSQGEVLYDGTPVQAIAPGALARRRAVLSQHVDMAFPLSVEDVVLMGRYPHYGRTPTVHDREVVERALALVDMTAQRAQLYPTLSGGEQQKAQLARVLAQIWNYDGSPEPRVLFLDEPTSSLDVHYQIHLLDLARDLLRHDCTVIAVLHDLNVALHYGDHFFVLEHGRLAHEAAGAADIPGALLERVFRVRAHRVSDPESGEGFWRFSRQG